MKRHFKLRVNGELFEIETHSHRTLLDVLRNELNLTGTKKGCDQGECGACTVIMDGDPVNSCLVLIPDAEGKEIQQGIDSKFHESHLSSAAKHAGRHVRA